MAATAAFRITRDADVVLQDDEQIEDLLRAMEEVVLSRRRREPVRLTISARPDPRLKKWLADWLKLPDGQIYEVDGPQEASASGRSSTAGEWRSCGVEDWPPQVPRNLVGADDLWEAIEDHDVLLFHPYESFDPVVKLVEQAAEDPRVLAVKQTLYRTSGDSPIVRALARAAQNGKEVTVLVELKARFDEWRNVNWARRLEDAGVHVIYGIAGFKTHAKALLIVRREAGRIAALRPPRHRQLQRPHRPALFRHGPDDLPTARLAADVASFFNLLTGYSETVGWSKLAVAPVGLRQKFIDLIDREIQVSSPDRPGLIMAKTNSLQDPRDLPRPVPRQPGGRQGDAQRPRRLLPAAGGRRLLGQHRGLLDHRPVPRTCPHLLFPQRRARGGVPQQRRLDEAEPEQASGIALSHRRRQHPAAADRRLADLFCRQRQGMAAPQRRPL